MQEPDSRIDADLEQFRPYLKNLAAARVSRRLRDRIDVSGIVQETFLEACRDRQRLRDEAPPSRLHWLRRILAHNLTDALRALRSRKRDVGRERSLEELLARSSAALADVPARGDATPSAVVQRGETTLRVAAALAALPDAQREALILQYWDGCSLIEISQRMGRTPAAVAGLLKRGTKQLRLLLEAKEQT